MNSSNADPQPSSIRNRVREVRWVRGGNLRPNPKNWRRHPGAQADALAALLMEIGIAGALIARELPDGTLELIDGHLRAQQNPDTLFLVLVLDVSEAEADKLLLTMDPLAGMAEADIDRIRTLLETVHTESEALQELLRRTAGEGLCQIVHPHEVSEAEVSLNRADELRQKWGTRAGQIWRAGEHRIICGDSTNQLDIEHLFKGGRNCRMLWTDPPYGVNYAAKNAYLNRTDRGNRIQKPIENDHLSPEQICALFKAALAAPIPYCEPGAAGYATVASGRSLPFFIDGFEAAGFRLKANLVWVKNQFVLGMSDYQPRHELIIYGWLENGPHYFVDDRTQDSVFEVDRPAVSSLHPTAKPIELIARMVANSSRTGDLVYDPFCGSGSTIVAAHQLGRIGYGCEIDAGYVAVTLERLELLGLKPALADE